MLELIRGDRRVDRRYEFELNLRFSCEHRGVKYTGFGNTLDLGRGGIRFQTEVPPPDGAQAELRIAWPFKLQNVCPLELLVRGSVLRTGPRGTVLKMTSYEFRTCGERSFDQAAAPAACSIIG